MARARSPCPRERLPYRWVATFTHYRIVAGTPMNSQPHRTSVWRSIRGMPNRRCSQRHILGQSWAIRKFRGYDLVLPKLLPNCRLTLFLLGATRNASDEVVNVAATSATP